MRELKIKDNEKIYKMWFFKELKKENTKESNFRILIIYDVKEKIMNFIISKIVTITNLELIKT
jgi:hypothetical protein